MDVSVSSALVMASLTVKLRENVAYAAGDRDPDCISSAHVHLSTCQVHWMRTVHARLVTLMCLRVSVCVCVCVG